MIPQGFLGTQADLIIDTILVMFILWPFVVLVAIRFASYGHYYQHRNFQIAIFLCVSLLVLALEIDLRFTDLLIDIKKTAMYNSMLAKSVFFIHLIIVSSTYLIWVMLLMRSILRFNTQLPGSFSKRHRFWGRILMVGLVLTSMTGVALYVIVFVMT